MAQITITRIKILVIISKQLFLKQRYPRAQCAMQSEKKMTEK